MSSNLWLVAGGAVAGIIAAIVVVLSVSGSSDNRQDTESRAAAAPAQSPTAEPTLPPTSTPPPATATPEPTAVPAAEPVAVLPDRTSCAAIRGTDYRSETEHQWFLANCTGAPAPAPAGAVRPAPTSPPAPSAGGPPPASGPTEEERRYRTQASAQLAYFAARIQGTAALADQTNLANYALMVGGDCDNFVNALTGMEPAPPRFKAVHDQLKGAIAAFGAHFKAGRNVTTLREFNAWYATAEVLAYRADLAIDNYNRVVGVKLPNLR